MLRLLNEYLREARFWTLPCTCLIFRPSTQSFRVYLRLGLYRTRMSRVYYAESGAICPRVDGK